MLIFLAHLDSYFAFLNKHILKIVNEILVSLFIEGHWTSVRGGLIVLVSLGVLLNIFASTIKVLQRVIVVEMKHFFNAQQNIDCPMFAGLPFWKFIH